MRRTSAVAAGLFVLLAVSACDPGSKSFSDEYYRVDLSVSQQPATGAVVVTGDTDLPDNTPVEALLTTATSAPQATEGALVSGSLSQPGAAPVKKGRFTLTLATPLPSTCHNQPPCGPFAAGTYLLVVDIRVSKETNGEINVDQDGRFLDQTHGFSQFAGLELTKRVTLQQPIGLRIDENGQVAVGTPAPSATPSA